MNRLNKILCTGLVLLAAGTGEAAEKVNVIRLIDRAKDAYIFNRRDEAFALVTQAIEAEPQNPHGYFVRARFHEGNEASANAVADYDQVLKLDPKLADAWLHRGEQRFKLGEINKAISDFDKFIELVPRMEPHHWQRGIAYYYAGRFADGRKQFEQHRTVNPADVENAAWHFLCVARESGVEKARASLMPVENDPRVPMKKIHELFAGKATPEDVLKAAASSGAPTLDLNRQLFFANFYVGLYFEAIGDEQRAKEFISKATGPFRTRDYMGDVARVHLQLRWPEKKSAAPAKPN